MADYVYLMECYCYIEDDLDMRGFEAFHLRELLYAGADFTPVSDREDYKSAFEKYASTELKQLAKIPAELRKLIGREDYCKLTDKEKEALASIDENTLTDKQKKALYQKWTQVRYSPL